MPSNKNDWCSPERLYLNAQGKAVKADDPARVSLLVAAGGCIPMAQAQGLGLVSEPAPEAPAQKAVTTAPATKAITVAPQNKGKGKKR